MNDIFKIIKECDVSDLCEAYDSCDRDCEACMFNDIATLHNRINHIEKSQDMRVEDLKKSGEKKQESIENLGKKLLKQSEEIEGLKLESNKNFHAKEAKRMMLEDAEIEVKELKNKLEYANSVIKQRNNELSRNSEEKKKEPEADIDKIKTEVESELSIHDFSQYFTFKVSMWDFIKQYYEKMHKDNIMMGQEICAVVGSIPENCTVLVRQGGGAEDICASLAVSVAKMKKRANKADELLESAVAGINWYKENNPEITNGCDDEMLEQINEFLKQAK